MSPKFQVPSLKEETRDGGLETRGSLINGRGNWIPACAGMTTSLVPTESVIPGKAAGRDPGSSIYETSSGSSSPASSLQGFTLLEVLVAMAVLAVALVTLLGLHNRSLLLTIRAQRLSTGTLLAQEMLTRTQLEGVQAARRTTGDFAELYPGQYPEFRWYRSVRAAPIRGLWEVQVGVSWGPRADETCELTVFTPLEER